MNPHFKSQIDCIKEISKDEINDDLVLEVYQMISKAVQHYIDNIPELKELKEALKEERYKNVLKVHKMKK